MVGPPIRGEIMKDIYAKIREKFKDDDWVFGIGDEKGCSQAFDFDTNNPQPFSYLGVTNPDDFRIATDEEIAEANRKFDTHLSEVRI